MGQVFELSEEEEGLSSMLLRELDFSIGELKEIGFSGATAARIVTWVKKQKEPMTSSALWEELPGGNSPPYQCRLIDLAARLSPIWSFSEALCYAILAELVTVSAKDEQGALRVDRHKFENFLTTFGSSVLVEAGRVCARDFVDPEKQELIHSFHGYLSETEAMKRIPFPGGYLYRYGNSRPGTLCLTRASKRLTDKGLKQITSHNLAINKNGTWQDIGGGMYASLRDFQNALRDKLEGFVPFQHDAPWTPAVAAAFSTKSSYDTIDEAQVRYVTGEDIVGPLYNSPQMQLAGVLVDPNMPEAVKRKISFDRKGSEVVGPEVDSRRSFPS